MIKAEVKYRKQFSSEELEKFRNESIENLRNDVDVYKEIQKTGAKLSQVRDYLSLFLDFQEDFNYCKNCPGIDKCQKHNNHLQLTLTVEENAIERHLTLCPLMKEKMKLDKLYLYNDFPIEWRSAALESIKPLKSRTDIINACFNILGNDDKKWLYVHGLNTTGKTYILITLINELVKINKGPVAVLNSATRIKELNDLSFENKEQFNNMFETLCTVPVLLFDNFGSEYKNDYIRDTIVFPLLSIRKKSNLLTLFSSNFSLDEIEKLYSGKSKVGEIMARQLKCLIQESSQTEIALTGSGIFKKTAK